MSDTTLTAEQISALAVAASEAAAREAAALEAAAAKVALDCAKGSDELRSIVPTLDNVIPYMPGGIHVIRPSRGGQAVECTVIVDQSSAEALEAQRKALEAGGKKPYFSVGEDSHASDVAAFWPTEFFWDYRQDATGSFVYGVWARGEWSKRGKEAVEGKDFRTFSPTFWVDPMPPLRSSREKPARIVCEVDAVANMGALVNDPAFQKISPLWAKNSGEVSEPKRLLLATLRSALQGNEAARKELFEKMNLQWPDVILCKKYGVDEVANKTGLEGGAPMGNKNAAGSHDNVTYHSEKRAEYSRKYNDSDLRKGDTQSYQDVVAKSRDAHQASAKAYLTGEHNDHRAAHELHMQAAVLHNHEGRIKEASQHLTHASEHEQVFKGGIKAANSTGSAGLEARACHNALVAEHGLDITLDDVRREVFKRHQILLSNAEVAEQLSATKGLQAGAPVGNQNASKFGLGFKPRYQSDNPKTQARDAIEDSHAKSQIGKHAFFYHAALKKMDQPHIPATPSKDPSDLLGGDVGNDHEELAKEAAHHMKQMQYWASVAAKE